MSSSLSTDKQGAVLIVTIDRPKANAIDCDTSMELFNCFKAFEEDPDLQVAILTAKGEKFFSAGWDLSAAAEGEAVDAVHSPGGFAGLTEYFTRTKPIIAAVNGMAVGGGFELALSCDLIVAASHAQFFLPESKIGIAPDSGGVFRLPKVLPKHLAMEMLLTGRRLSAQEALHYGLVNHVADQERLLETATSLAAQVCESSPLALRAIKELVAVGESDDLAEAFRKQRSGSLKNYNLMLKSEDANEGALAFAEGRKPVWKGC